MFQGLSRHLSAFVLATSLSLLSLSASAGDYAFENPKSPPTGGEMVADALLVRPFMLVGTVITTATFIVTLPFSALGGNVGQAAERLVAEPAKYTFARPLGEL
ncbi:MAG TPA: hypothetical protein ENJ79_01550 [Gammaproteobacteria bacterium]|nr:hypothetical protein [Gammaproteobacteria bacterium]